MKKKIFLSDKWAVEVHKYNQSVTTADRYLTFYGALQRVYQQVAYHWNATTEKKNWSSYDKIILPCIDGHNDKCISEYTKEDYESIIEHIREKGFIGPYGEKKYYSDSTINSFKGLIYDVVYYSSVYGLCDNVLWGSDFQISIAENPEEDAIEEKIRLKKSLAPEEEVRFTCILDNDSLSGEQLGLLIMDGDGLRNAEVCALNYEDLKQLDGHPDTYTFWIYKSVIPKSSKLQSSGKTWNMGRIVPVPDKIVNKILMREEQLKQLLDENNLLKNVDIGKLPILNRGILSIETYAERCQAADLTNAAKDIFREIGLNPRELSFLEKELKAGGDEVVREKDSTAYLLRRNFATHAYLCGLTVAEIQYVLGHDVEDAYEARNDFVDAERLYQIARKLRERPLLNIIEDEKNVLIKTNDQMTVQIKVQALEPTDQLKIDIHGMPENAEIEAFLHSYVLHYPRFINIVKEYRNMYNQKQKTN